MKDAIKIKNSRGMLLGKRHMASLKPEEMERLKAFISETKGAFYKIRLNVGVHPKTVETGLNRGTFEAPVLLKLRKFIKLIEDGNQSVS